MPSSRNRRCSTSLQVGLRPVHLPALHSKPFAHLCLFSANHGGLPARPEQPLLQLLGPRRGLGPGPLPSTPLGLVNRAPFPLCIFLRAFWVLSPWSVSPWLDFCKHTQSFLELHLFHWTCLNFGYRHSFCGQSNDILLSPRASMSFKGFASL
jgi:hypothetical protein